MKKILKKLLQNCQIFKGKVNAFTLVEVMLVIGIIGIVAVLTIPPLVQKYEEMSWQTSASVFHRRLSEAFKIMQIERTLTGHNSTADFVNALGKKMKISKVCTMSEIGNCFPSKVLKVNGQTVDLTTYGTTADFGKADYGSELVGVVFANGVSAIIGYNKEFYASGDTEVAKLTPVSDKIVNISTNLISMLYDVSGFNTPNTIGQDVYSLNTNLGSNGSCGETKMGGYCVKNLGQISTYVNCSSTGSANTQYCGSLSSESATDYWAGSQYECGKLGMRLPTLAELQELWRINNETGNLPASGCYKSNETYDRNKGYYQEINFANGARACSNGSASSTIKNSNSGTRITLCISK